MDKSKEILEETQEQVLPISDEELIGKFFAEQTFDVADHGFTNRVMHRLPDRSVRLNKIWTAVCAIAVVAVFILTKGWIPLLGSLQGLLADTVTSVSQLTLASAFATVVTLSALACYGLANNVKRYI